MNKQINQNEAEEEWSRVSNQSTMKLFIRRHDFRRALSSWRVEVLQSHMEEHTLEHNVTFICIYSEALS